MRVEIDTEVTITVDNSVPEFVYCVKCGEKIPVYFSRWEGSSRYGYNTYRGPLLVCKNEHQMTLYFGSYGG